MANDENYMLSLADSLWNGYYKSRVAESIAPCVKRKKMTVTTAPNATTGLIGVKEAFSDAEAMIPFVSTIGNVAVGTTVWVEWTYSASNMIAVSAGTGDTYVVETVQNSQGWKNVVTEVKESASALRLILSNEESTVYTNEDGSGGDYEQCVTTAFVYYGTTNVSSFATYTYVASTGVTGSWDEASRKYSVSAMSATTGRVTITATFTNESGATLTASKVFTVKKSPTGATQRVYYVKPQWLTLSAVDTVTRYKYYVESSISQSVNVYFESDDVTYWFATPTNANYGDYYVIDLTAWTVQQFIPGVIGPQSATLYQTTRSGAAHYKNIAENGNRTRAIAPNEFGSSRTYKNSYGTTISSFVVNAYYKVGAAGTQTAYSGRFIIEESQNGATWEQKYDSSANESSRTYSPTDTALLIRCSLYMPDGTTLLDQQTVSILTSVSLTYMKSAIEQQSDKISLVVSETSGGNTINTASIVTSINQSGSLIALNADKINFKTGNFVIRNQNNVETFGVDSDGNTKFSGEITASSGQIGPWIVNSYGFYSGGWGPGIYPTYYLGTTPIEWENPYLPNTYLYVVAKFNNVVIASDGALHAPAVIAHGDLSSTGTASLQGPVVTNNNIYPAIAGWGSVGTYDNPYGAVYTNSTPAPSTRESKENISSMSNIAYWDLDGFYPVTFTSKLDPEHRAQIGFIAEDIADACPYVVSFNENGKPTGIDYARLSVVAIYEIQKLRKRVKELEEKAQ